MKPQRFIAFVGQYRLSEGVLSEVVTAAKHAFDESSPAHLLIFNAETSEPYHVDLSGELSQVLKRLPPDKLSPIQENIAEQLIPVRSVGRPKLGVIAREVTLLPRHWEWLAEQPGGASITLRKLVEQARKQHHPQEENRKRRDSAYRFMYAIAGDLSGFEEATRALFADDYPLFFSQISHWSNDVQMHLKALLKIEN